MMNSLLNWLKPKTAMIDENANGEAGNVAKQRLQLLLIHDRTHMPAQKMELLKRDLLEVLSRYAEVDTSQIEIALEQLPDSRQMAFVSNVPVKRIKEDLQ